MEHALNPYEGMNVGHLRGKYIGFLILGAYYTRYPNSFGK